MFLTDYHTHTRLSFDSEADPLAMLAAARAAGLRELCFTDHLDFLNTDGRFIGLERDGRPIYDPDWVAEHSDGALTLRAGVELGEAWEDPALAGEVGRWPVDFIIGSIHNLDTQHGGMDFYEARYPDQAFCHQVLDTYFSCMERLVELDCFDILAHVVYPLRYMNDREGNQISLSPYYPRLEGIFRTLIANGKGIELNTNRGAQVEVWRDILALYRDCGGAIITLGSDAHVPEHVGRGIAQGAALLKEYGFDLATYEKRQPRLEKL